MTVFTEAEVSKHHNVHDLWVSIRGRVYDVTGYVEDHPGGIEVLKDVAGSDGTESFEYVGHSDDAYKVLQRFQVGTLESGVRSVWLDLAIAIALLILSTDRGRGRRKTEPSLGYISCSA
ncbi:cytochrome b5 [Colletotrichum truncatum]|uniref:Cytochrome b5 n=1 Tax=Colletotrichum truncatum TaxID=5467 RepID=A0ACC3YNC6_COLTU|nr:cytochrome b5 [Colletotrichum truncatum]KAF6789504.1 cytochrome b5 [Colletotrichum truncatum]